MAEKRFISRRITESDRIRQLANDGKLLATTLYAFFLPFLDKAGRMNANPLLLKGGMFEGYDWTVEQLDEAVRDLARVGLVRLYSNGKFGHLIQYEKFLTADGGFNKPHDKEPDSDLPGPDDAGSTPVIVQDAKPRKTGTDRNSDQPPPEPVREDSGKPPGDDPAYIEVKREIEIEREPRAHAREAGARQEGKKGNQAKLGDFDASKIALPDHVTPDVWASFVKHRNQKRKPLTEESTREILQLLDQHPLDADKMLRQTIAAGWTRVFQLDRRRDNRPEPPPRPKPRTAQGDWAELLRAHKSGRWDASTLSVAGKAALDAIGGWTTIYPDDPTELETARRKFFHAYTESSSGKDAA